MKKSKEKIIKKYLSSLTKEKNKDFKKCLKNSKNKDFYYFLSKYAKFHPLDFFTFMKKYLFKDINYSKNNNFLLSLLNERIITTKGNHILKRYIGYIFEWQTLFSDDDTKRLKENESSGNNLQSFRDLFDNFICNGLLENLNLKTFSKKITCDGYYKDIFYNDLYIAYYHQESTQSPLFSRISFIYDLLGKDYIKELEKLKKFLLIFAGIIYYANKKNVFFIELDELLNNYLSKTVISKEDVLEFLDFIGVDDYKKYVKKVKTKNYSDYFLGKTDYDFINIELEIHKTPFINISNEIGKNDFYIFDESFLLKKFYSKLGNFTYDKINKKNMTFGDIIEKYILSFVENWLNYKDSKIKNNYIVKQGIKFKDGEIDLLIYNKDTKNLIIFESKDYKILNENLFGIEDIENLCKKEVKREINGKVKTEPGSIYKGINQLYKHSKRKKEEISKKIGVENINNIKYIFLTHNNSIFWNEIIRHYIDKNKEFQGLDYQFMNLTEFEMLISLGCKNGLDFYNLIEEKSEKIDCGDRYKVVLESFSAYNEKGDGFGTSNAKGINQNFNIFFYKEYGYDGDNIAPFVSHDFFKELFKGQ